ncbi:MAG: hypothetical protein ABIK92_09080 [Pseudomonadota bacterium]
MKMLPGLKKLAFVYSERPIVDVWVVISGSEPKYRCASKRLRIDKW